MSDVVPKLYKLIPQAIRTLVEATGTNLRNFVLWYLKKKKPPTKAQVVTYLKARTHLDTGSSSSNSGQHIPPVAPSIVFQRDLLAVGIPGDIARQALIDNMSREQVINWFNSQPPSQRTLSAFILHFHPPPVPPPRPAPPAPKRPPLKLVKKVHADMKKGPGADAVAQHDIAKSIAEKAAHARAVKQEELDNMYREQLAQVKFYGRLVPPEIQQVAVEDRVPAQVVSDFMRSYPHITTGYTFRQYLLNQDNPNYLPVAPIPLRPPIRPPRPAPSAPVAPAPALAEPAPPPRSKPAPPARPTRSSAPMPDATPPRHSGANLSNQTQAEVRRVLGQKFLDEFMIVYRQLNENNLPESLLTFVNRYFYLQQQIPGDLWVRMIKDLEATDPVGLAFIARVNELMEGKKSRRDPLNASDCKYVMQERNEDKLLKKSGFQPLAGTIPPRTLTKKEKAREDKLEREFQDTLDLKDPMKDAEDILVQYMYQIQTIPKLFGDKIRKFCRSANLKKLVQATIAMNEMIQRPDFGTEQDRARFHELVYEWILEYGTMRIDAGSNSEYLGDIDDVIALLAMLEDGMPRGFQYRNLVSSLVNDYNAELNSPPTDGHQPITDRTGSKGMVTGLEYGATKIAEATTNFMIYLKNRERQSKSRHAGGASK